jgi:hypothetical protein
MDQAVTRRLLSGPPRVQSQARPCESAGGQNMLKMLPECVKCRCKFIVSGRKGPIHPGYTQSTPHTNLHVTHWYFVDEQGTSSITTRMLFWEVMDPLGWNQASSLSWPSVASISPACTPWRHQLTNFALASRSVRRSLLTTGVRYGWKCSNFVALAHPETYFWIHISCCNSIQRIYHIEIHTATAAEKLKYCNNPNKQSRDELARGFVVDHQQLDWQSLVSGTGLWRLTKRNCILPTLCCVSYKSHIKQHQLSDI